MKKHLLFTRDKAAAAEEIKTIGGKINQVFSEVLISAQLPEQIDPATLQFATTDVPSNLDFQSALAKAGWEEGLQKAAEGAPHANQGLPWDTPGYQTPAELMTLASSIGRPGDSIALSTGTPTSLYMIGGIAVGVVLVSGPDPYRLSENEIRLVVSEVQEGLEFLAAAEPRARVSFVYDIQVISVRASPGDTATFESAEAPWRNEALQVMGYESNLNGSIAYVIDLKARNGTDWAYVAYFTKYPLHHFAYALNERLVMHYQNDNWGPNAINKVFAHETCHIFGAADEYGNCNCSTTHGHLGVPNRNCRSCSPHFTPCLMEQNDLVLCDWTRRQIGWDEALFPA